MDSGGFVVAFLLSLSWILETSGSRYQINKCQMIEKFFFFLSISSIFSDSG